MILSSSDVNTNESITLTFVLLFFDFMKQSKKNKTSIRSILCAVFTLELWDTWEEKRVLEMFLFKTSTDFDFCTERKNVFAFTTRRITCHCRESCVIDEQWSGLWRLWELNESSIESNDQFPCRSLENKKNIFCEFCFFFVFNLLLLRRE